MNAGIADAARLGEISEELYDCIFDINVKGAVFTVQKALPLLREGASIILTSSAVGSKGLHSDAGRLQERLAQPRAARAIVRDLRLQ